MYGELLPGERTRLHAAFARALADEAPTGGRRVPGGRARLSLAGRARPAARVRRVDQGGHRGRGDLRLRRGAGGLRARARALGPGPGRGCARPARPGRAPDARRVPRRRPGARPARWPTSARPSPWSIRRPTRREPGCSTNGWVNTARLSSTTASDPRRVPGGGPPGAQRSHRRPPARGSCPGLAATTPRPTGRPKPWRSAKRRSRSRGRRARRRSRAGRSCHLAGRWCCWVMSRPASRPFVAPARSRLNSAMCTRSPAPRPGWSGALCEAGRYDEAVAAGLEAEAYASRHGLGARWAPVALHAHGLGALRARALGRGGGGVGSGTAIRAVTASTSSSVEAQLLLLEAHRGQFEAANRRAPRVRLLAEQFSSGLRPAALAELALWQDDPLAARAAVASARLPTRTFRRRTWAGRSPRGSGRRRTSRHSRGRGMPRPNSRNRAPAAPRSSRECGRRYEDVAARLPHLHHRGWRRSSRRARRSSRASKATPDPDRWAAAAAAWERAPDPH